MRKRKIYGHLLLVLGLFSLGTMAYADSCDGDPGGDNHYECIVIKNYIPTPITMSPSNDDCTDNTEGRFNATVPAATASGPGIWHQKLGMNPIDGCSILCGPTPGLGGTRLTLNFANAGTTSMHLCVGMSGISDDFSSTTGQVYPSQSGGDTTISLGRPGH